MSLGAGARRKLARVGAVRIHREHLGLGLALAGLEGKIGGVEQPLRSCRRVGGHGASAQDRRKAKRRRRTNTLRRYRLHSAKYME